MECSLFTKLYSNFIVIGTGTVNLAILISDFFFLKENCFEIAGTEECFFVVCPSIL